MISNIGRYNDRIVYVDYSYVLSTYDAGKFIFKNIKIYKTFKISMFRSIKCVIYRHYSSHLIHITIIYSSLPLMFIQTLKSSQRAPPIKSLKYARTVWILHVIELSLIGSFNFFLWIKSLDLTKWYYLWRGICDITEFTRLGYR